MKSVSILHINETLSDLIFPYQTKDDIIIHLYIMLLLNIVTFFFIGNCFFAPKLRNAMAVCTSIVSFYHVVLWLKRFQ